MTGDPVVVVGRLYTRDWADGEGNNRTSYEVEAVAVGHDLSRGKARFLRTRAAGATSELDDDEGAMRARGEPTEEVADGDVPARYGDSDDLFDDSELADLPDGTPGGAGARLTAHPAPLAAVCRPSTAANTVPR